MSLPASPSPFPLVASAPDPFLQHLNDFFRHLATFHYDKAKDVAVRETQRPFLSSTIEPVLDPVAGEDA